MYVDGMSTMRVCNGVEEQTWEKRQRSHNAQWERGLSVTDIATSGLFLCFITSRAATVCYRYKQVLITNSLAPVGPAGSWDVAGWPGADAARLAAATAASAVEVAAAATAATAVVAAAAGLFAAVSI